MDEEKKVYPITGTVTISTEEYSDIVSEMAEARIRYNDYSTKYWVERSRRENLEKEVETLKQELQGMKDFLYSDVEVNKKYFAWKNRPADEEQESEY